MTESILVISSFSTYPAALNNTFFNRFNSLLKVIKASYVLCNSYSLRLLSSKEALSKGSVV